MLLLNKMLIKVKDALVLLKPGVMLLIVYSAITGIYLTNSTIDFLTTVLIVLSIALGSGGAAAFNMWYDRDIDKIMVRTRNRPLPDGRMQPVCALVFSVILMFIAVWLLLVVSNLLAASLLAFSIFFYAIVYTVLLKRRTVHNIVVGGLPGALPPVIGWVAVGESILDIMPWLLFVIIFLWTPSHFWALAVYRNNDYKQAGVPMLPVVYGIRKTKIQIVIYSLLLILSSLILAVYSDVYLRHSIAYLVVTLILGAIYLYLAFKLMKSDNAKYGIRLFAYSIFYLFLLFSALMISKIASL